MPLPVSERANNKFKTRLRVLYQIIQVISDQNYLLEELATGQKKVVHHDLMRYIPEVLAQKIADRNNLPVAAMEKTAILQVQGGQDSYEELHDLMSEWDEDDTELHGMKSHHKRKEKTQTSTSRPKLADDDVVELRRSKRNRRPPRWLDDYVT